MKFDVADVTEGGEIFKRIGPTGSPLNYMMGFQVTLLAALLACEVITLETLSSEVGPCLCIVIAVMFFTGSTLPVRVVRPSFCTKSDLIDKREVFGCFGVMPRKEIGELPPGIWFDLPPAATSTKLDRISLAGFALAPLVMIGKIFGDAATVFCWFYLAAAATGTKIRATFSYCNLRFAIPRSGMSDAGIVPCDVFGHMPC